MDIISMIKELLTANQLDRAIPNNINIQEIMLDDLRTICKPAELSDQYYENESEYIWSKRDTENLVKVDTINDQLLDNIYIYLGDITKIKADAIVNAANEKLLGCIAPGHNCIDNAIHLGAGLRLRNACSDIMIAQGYDEPEGLAKITKGYQLPSKYIIHTVGPDIHKLRRTTDSDNIENALYEQLSACYKSILLLADSYDDINNIVFCSISTGVYGVPIETAAMIALRTIKEHLKENEYKQKVIINVFSKEDYNEYKKQAEQIRSENN